MPFTYDENGALLVTGLISGTGNVNEVAYWTASTTLGGDSGLLVDAANDLFIVANDGGIGISNAAEKLEFFTAGYATFLGCNVGAGGIPNPTGSHTRNFTVANTSAPVGIALWCENDSLNSTAVGHMDWVAGSAVKSVISRITSFTLSTNEDSGRIVCYTKATGAALTEAMRLEVDGYAGFNKSSPNRRTHAVSDSATGTVIIPISRIESQVSGGAGSTGHGPGFEYFGETSTTINTAMSITASRWSDATHASRRARFEIRNYYIANEVLCGVIEAPGAGSVDGNARGVGAVDFQNSRGGAAQVASGNYSCIIAGDNNTNSGTNSGIIAGTTNTIAGTYSGILAGSSNNISAGTRSAILAGDSNTISDNDCIAFGSGCTADGIQSIAGGTSADTNGFDGVFIWADGIGGAFTADRDYQFKIRCNGTATFVITDTAAALPVAEFNQADVDEPFHKFVGDAAAANLTRDLVDEGDVSTATRIGWYKIEILDDGNQIADGDYYVPFYTLA